MRSDSVLLSVLRSNFPVHIRSGSVLLPVLHPRFLVHMRSGSALLSVPLPKFLVRCDSGSVPYWYRLLCNVPASADSDEPWSSSFWRSQTPAPQHADTASRPVFSELRIWTPWTKVQFPSGLPLPCRLPAPPNHCICHSISYCACGYFRSPAALRRCTDRSPLKIVQVSTPVPGYYL